MSGAGSGETRERFNPSLAIIDSMMGSGLVTIEKGKVLRYGTERIR